jgi:hypothetical protein
MGSANADELIKYSKTLPVGDIIEYAYKYSEKIIEYYNLWKEYKPE